MVFINNRMKSDIKEAIDKAGIKDKNIVEKLLRIHGQNIPDSNLSGALNLLVDKYQLNEMHFGGASDLQGTEDSSRGTPHDVLKLKQNSKKSLRNFILRKARQARVGRSKSRAQHARDRFDGRIAALDDILRYLKRR